MVYSILETNQNTDFIPYREALAGKDKARYHETKEMKE